jgi:hypothetical protein
MTDTKRNSIGVFLLSAILLAGCGGGIGGCGDQKPEEMQTTSLGPTVDGGTSTTATAAPEEEGPQYQHPTVENLQGKPQRFPAKFPVKRYPNSRVVMAVVEPNLRPGQHNVVLLNSSDEQKTVARFYYTDLLKEGWKPVYSSGNSAYSQIKYVKGDKEVEVRVFPDPRGKQHVQLLSGPYKPDAVYEKVVPKDPS